MRFQRAYDSEPGLQTANFRNVFPLPGTIPHGRIISAPCKDFWVETSKNAPTMLARAPSLARLSYAVRKRRQGRPRHNNIAANPYPLANRGLKRKWAPTSRFTTSCGTPRPCTLCKGRGTRGKKTGQLRFLFEMPRDQQRDRQKVMWTANCRNRLLPTVCLITP